MTLRTPVYLVACLIPAASGQGFVGSQTCKTCHSEIYGRWSKTRMANVVVDPKLHPEAILPDLSNPNPLVTFKKEDIAFTYGSKWKQRYFQKVGDDYFPLGAQWDVKNQVWRAYQVAANTDWWTVHYPGGNSTRPTGPLCDGCHSVNYNIQTKQVTEWNVGCEKCHGPGAAHATAPSRSNIVNPARLNSFAATDTCIQCHSQGQPLVSPNGVTGRYYDWPVGYQPGLALKDFWKLEEAKLGSTTFTHFADGTGHKNRMQGNDYVQSVMYVNGITCSACHDVHGTSNNADLIKPASVLCQTCHGQKAGHSGHKPNSPGNECVACHMPAIETTIANVNVRSHTFKFIRPSMTEAYKIPNPCTTCHTDKPLTWATEALKSWPQHSPWRLLLSLLLLASAFFLSTPAYALSCGDTIPTNTTLTADLHCTFTDGLIVGASNVTIDLNGHTISCTGAPGGFLGSCQKTANANYINLVGVKSTGHNGVVVRGPGIITGFGVGVRLDNGTGMDAIGLTITGPQPSTDFTAKDRLLTVGVVVANTNCGFSALAAGWSSVVEFNDISQQTQGVQLSNANCVLVSTNNVHDNAGLSDSHGIDVISSSTNTITSNTVIQNGASVKGLVPDGGILVFDATTGGVSRFNQIYFNYVTNNCGDGVTLANGAANNNVAANVALNNSVAAKCGVPVGTFFDVADRNEGSGNIWNANNTCKTQGPGIPAGVCP